MGYLGQEKHRERRCLPGERRGQAAGAVAGQVQCPPDGLVGDPAGVALLVAAQVGGVELLGGGDAGSDAGTGILSLGKGVGVAPGALPVVEHDPCVGHGTPVSRETAPSRPPPKKPLPGWKYL